MAKFLAFKKYKFYEILIKNNKRYEDQSVSKNICLKQNYRKYQQVEVRF